MSAAPGMRAPYRKAGPSKVTSSDVAKRVFLLNQEGLGPEAIAMRLGCNRSYVARVLDMPASAFR